VACWTIENGTEDLRMEELEEGGWKGGGKGLLIEGRRDEVDFSQFERDRTFR